MRLKPVGDDPPGPCSGETAYEPSDGTAARAPSKGKVSSAAVTASQRENSKPAGGEPATPLALAACHRRPAPPQVASSSSRRVQLKPADPGVGRKS